MTDPLPSSPRPRLRPWPAAITAVALALASGCSDQPGDAKTRPPITLNISGDQPSALVDLKAIGSASVLEAIRGQSNLDDLDYTAKPAPPPPVRLPTAAPAIDSLLLFPREESYDPDNPAHVAKIREAFTGKKPVAVRLQAIEWTAARQDQRFVDNIAGEMKAGSLIATPAADALSRFAGSAATPRARDALVAVLASTDYLLRAAAVKALARLGDSRALPALRARFADEKTQYNRVLLCHALGYLCLHGEPTVTSAEVAAVQTVLRKPQTDIREDPLVRAEAAVALVATGDTRALTFLKSLADQAAAPEIQYLGMEGLVLAGAAEAPLYVLMGLDSDHPLVWTGALQLTSRLPAEAIVPALEKTVREGDSRRAAPRAVLALAWLQQESALTWLPYIVASGETGERILALELLGAYRRPEHAELCAGCLDDPSPGVREAAARALFLMNATSYAARIAESGRYGNPYTRAVLTEIAARLARNADLANAPPTPGQRMSPPADQTRQLEQSLLRLQQETLEKIRLVSIATANGQPVAGVFRDADGREKTVLVGEYVYAGFALVGFESPTGGTPPAHRPTHTVALLADGRLQAGYTLNAAPILSTVAKASPARPAP